MDIIRTTRHWWRTWRLPGASGRFQNRGSQPSAVRTRVIRDQIAQLEMLEDSGDPLQPGSILALTQGLRLLTGTAVAATDPANAGSESGYESVDPILLIDDVLMLFQQEFERSRTDLLLEIPAELPLLLTIETGLLKQQLVDLIEAQLSSDLSSLNLNVRYAASHLTIRVNQDHCAVPATFVSDCKPPHRDGHILLLADDAKLAQTLTVRLHRLGYSLASSPDPLTTTCCIVCPPLSTGLQVTRNNLPAQLPVLEWTGSLTQRQLMGRLADSHDLPGDLQAQKSVLIVDDVPAVVRVLHDQLVALDCRVETADSGVEAITAIKKQAFDLVFMDIQLPDMNGREVAEHMIRHVPSLKVVGLTAHATVREKNACRQAGMLDVLLKPVRTSTLRDLLAGRGSAALAAEAQVQLAVFDPQLALQNAGNRPELALELLQVMLQLLPDDTRDIMATSDHDQLKRRVHHLNGAVRFCGVPRLARAVSGLESALKENTELVDAMKHLLNAEVMALLDWARLNPDVMTRDWFDQQQQHRPSHSDAHQRG